MRKLTTILFLLAIPIAHFSQSKVTIENFDYSFDGKVITIHYDILHSKNGAKFFVSIKPLRMNGQEIKANNLTGDVNLSVVYGGPGKQIIWDLDKDNIILNEEIRFELTWKPELDVYMGKHITKSLLFPGSGDYKLRNGKNYWLYGVAAYGLLASSIYLNSKANTSYSDYKKEMDIPTRNDYYQDYQNQLRLSHSCAGLGASVWIADIYGIFKKSKKVQSDPVPDQSHYYYQLAKSSYKAFSPAKHIDNRTPYHIAMDKGNAYFANELYAQAQSSYQEALKYNANDEVAQIRLNETKKIIRDINIAKEKELAEQKRKDDLYRNTISQADSLFYAHKYELAIIKYRNAIDIRPAGNYPKNQVEEIEVILKKQKKDNEFTDLCSQAEAAFKAENYEFAKQKYEDALGIKSDALVLQKIKDIDKLVEKKRIDSEFQNNINLADQYLRQEMYTDAQYYYQNALELKPEAYYPKQQIKKIEKALKEKNTIKIPLVSHGNTKYIKARLNGTLEFDFVLDTGADNVLISPEIFLTFYRSGVITKDDIISDEVFSIADGSTVIGLTFYFKKINIGEIELENVLGSVIGTGQTDCLLGGSVFSKLGQITIDYDNNLLKIEKK